MIVFYFCRGLQPREKEICKQVKSQGGGSGGADVRELLYAGFHS